MNLPFSFSTLYAFKLALLFDSKREINLQSLCEYREVSNKLMIEDYNKTFNEEESPEQVDYMQEIRDFLMKKMLIPNWQNCSLLF